jgi:hypothetical protein
MESFKRFEKRKIPRKEKYYQDSKVPIKLNFEEKIRDEDFKENYLFRSLDFKSKLRNIFNQTFKYK